MKFRLVEDVEQNSIDEQYMLYLGKDQLTMAQKMVLEQAKKNGYDTVVYHGSSKFGFTKIQKNKLANGVSFFASGDTLTAKSYGPPGQDANFKAIHQHKVRDRVAEILDIFNSRSKEEQDTIKTIIKQQCKYKGEYLKKATAKKECNYFKYLCKEQKIKISRDELKQVYNIFIDDPSYGMGIYTLIANTDNLYEIDCKHAHWHSIKVPPEISADFSDYLDSTFTRDEDQIYLNSVGRDTTSTDMLAIYIKETTDYRGIKFINLQDRDTGRDPKHMKGVGTDVYTFFYPAEQLKSADTVTYDGNGDIIPLSKRFNSSADDLREEQEDDI